MSRFKYVLAGSALAVALLAVPVAPAATPHPAGSSSSTFAAPDSTACINCWSAAAS